LRGDVAERARDLIRQICESREIKDYSWRGIAAGPYSRIGGGTVASGAIEDCAIHQSRSSRRLQEEFPALRKRIGDTSVGQRVFCATVGAVDEKTIMAYIENQKWDEDDQGFKITAPTEP
jgi:REP-associated tyrosine transposase